MVLLTNISNSKLSIPAPICQRKKFESKLTPSQSLGYLYIGLIRSLEVIHILKHVVLGFMHINGQPLLKNQRTLLA